MLARAHPGHGAPNLDPDQRVFMNGLDWWQFETMLAIRGDRARPRFAYLDGTLEIASPSRSHEYITKMISRLLEAYAEEAGIFFDGYGSLTMKNPAAKRGLEPDECYAIGSAKDHPDLAIEVIWTSGGIDKRAIYLGLGVRELWEWEDGRIEVLVLRGGAYVKAARSEVLPKLDLTVLTTFVDRDDQTEAVRAYRKTLRATARRRR